MKTLFWKLVTPLSFILFLASMYVFIKDISFIIVLVLALILHELGHGLAMKLTGQKFKFVFIPFLGASAVPCDKYQYYQDSDNHKILIALAGPIVNFILMLIGLWCMSSFPETANIANKIFFINGNLLVFNLIPLGPLDGSKIATALIRSTESLKATKLILVLYFLFLSVSTLTLFFGIVNNTLNPWITIGIIIISVFCLNWKLIPHVGELYSIMYDKTAQTITGKTGLALSLTYLALTGVNIYLLVL